MSSEIDQIKDRIDIIDLVSEYIPLKKAGINHQARCPFHNEKTPSFYVSSERGTYKCFGCGEGGDIFTFTEKMEGINFRGALEKLAAKAGVTLSNKIPQKVNKKTDVYTSILEHVTLFWQQELGSNEQAKNYLKQRGFTAEIVREYRVGFAPDDWNKAKDYLLLKGFTESDIEAVGVIKTGEKGTTYDRFRSRIMFPLFSITGSPIAFSGRLFGEDDGKTAKYINSPETPLFNKSKVLYGLHSAKQVMRKHNFALIVEGQVDLIMSQQVFPNTVATSGTSLTTSHLQLLKRFTDRLVFVYDGDSAGLESAYRGSLLGLGLDFEIKVATLPEGKDPADLILENPTTFKEVISAAEDVFDFYLAHISKTHSGRAQNQALEEKLFPLFYAVENPLEYDRYVTKTSAKLAISKQALTERLIQKKPKNRSDNYVDTAANTEQKQSEVTETPTSNVLVRVANIILWQQSLPDDKQWIKVRDILAHFSDSIQNSIKERVELIPGNIHDEIFFRLENLYKTPIILQNDIIEMKERFDNLESEQKLDTLQKKLQQAEQEGRDHDKEEIKKEIVNILNKKNAS